MDNDSTVEYSDPMYYFMQGTLYAEYSKDGHNKTKRFGEFVITSGKMAKYIGTDWPELFNEKDENTAFNMLMEFGRNRHFGENSSSMMDVFAIVSKSNAEIDKKETANRAALKAASIKTVNEVNISPNSDNLCSHRTGTLRGLTKKAIIDTLGFKPNKKDDPYKVVNSWGFNLNGEYCAIWDYKGSHKDLYWSTFGSDELFAKVFGENYSK